MLHLLPQSYIERLQREYRKRSLVAACNLLSFCLLVCALGLLPSLLLINAQKDQLEKQAHASQVKISDEEKALANAFESSVKRGLNIVGNSKALSSKHIASLLSIDRPGIIITGVSVVREDGSEHAQIEGVADTRSNLSSFIRAIDAGGEYKVDEVPASTFTKDRDLNFSLVLVKGTQEKQ